MNFKPIIAKFGLNFFLIWPDEDSADIFVQIIRIVEKNLYDFDGQLSF